METSIDINNNKFTDANEHKGYLAIKQNKPYDFEKLYRSSGVRNIKEDYRCFIRFRTNDLKK